MGPCRWYRDFIWIDWMIYWKWSASVEELFQFPDEGYRKKRYTLFRLGKPILNIYGCIALMQWIFSMLVHCVSKFEPLRKYMKTKLKGLRLFGAHLLRECKERRKVRNFKSISTPKSIGRYKGYHISFLFVSLSSSLLQRHLLSGRGEIGRRVTRERINTISSRRIKFNGNYQRLLYSVVSAKIMGPVIYSEVCALLNSGVQTPPRPPLSYGRIRTQRILQYWEKVGTKSRIDLKSLWTPQVRQAVFCGLLRSVHNQFNVLLSGRMENLIELIWIYLHVSPNRQFSFVLLPLSLNHGRVYMYAFLFEHVTLMWYTSLSMWWCSS